MPPTNHFTFETTAEDVAEAFALQIRGKTVLTTGVSPGGLGAYFVETIARYQPKLLILATRDISKARETAQAISSASPGVETRLLELDLGSQAQIRKAAEEVNAYAEPIDVLVNNAGVMACPYSTTKDGLESQFGTNHIGHFLFTNLIMAKIIAAGPGARTISVSSDGHRLSPIRFHDLNFSGGKTYDKWRAYGQSKTANMLFAVSIAEKLGSKGIQAFSLHPGVIGTNLGRFMADADIASLQALDRELGNKEGLELGFNFKTIMQGTATHVAASFDPSISGIYNSLANQANMDVKRTNPPTDHNGSFLLNSQLAPPDEIHPYAADKGNAEELWKISERIVGETFSY